MDAIVWFVAIGLLLVLMALAGSVLRRLPLSASILYLAAGFALGHLGLGRLSPVEDAVLLERVTEICVLVSLFSAGLKLRARLGSGRWRPGVHLASISLLLTIAMLAAVGVWGLGLPLAAAILLAAIVAPTDPVLASDVQVAEPGDRDEVRFGLTGEAGLNDGITFPFVMLGLGLLGLRGSDPQLLRWLGLDLIWACAAGLAIGALLAWLLGRLVVYLRVHHREAVGLDDFLALGLMALAYGVALLVHAYGFLAVFAAGLFLRRAEARATRSTEVPEAADDEMATDTTHAPAYLAQAVLGFTERLERIAEVAIMVLVGILLANQPVPAAALWFVPLLLLVVRPIAVLLGLWRTHTSHRQRALMAWFGIRGVGSLYYLFFAISHGLPADLAATLTPLVLTVVASSVVVHGISVTPLMQWYAARG